MINFFTCLYYGCNHIADLVIVEEMHVIILKDEQSHFHPYLSCICREKIVYIKTKRNKRINFHCPFVGNKLEKFLYLQTVICVYVLFGHLFGL